MKWHHAILYKAILYKSSPTGTTLVDALASNKEIESKGGIESTTQTL
jgi:hypothetical protein